MLDKVQNVVGAPVRGFFQFIREQGVVGLAIGFILGGAVSKVVSSLVTDIINPLIGLLIGNIGGLSEFTIGVVQAGRFITVLIDFVVVAAVVYWGFRGLGLHKLDVAKQKK